MKPDAKKLHRRSVHRCCAISRSPEPKSSVSPVPGGVESWVSSIASVFTSLYPVRRRIDVSGGGKRWRTEISWAVAVPEGNASCSLIIL